MCAVSSECVHFAKSTKTLIGIRSLFSFNNPEFIFVSRFELHEFNQELKV